MAKVIGSPDNLSRKDRRREKKAKHLQAIGAPRAPGSSPVVKAEEKARTNTAHLPSNIKGAHWLGRKAPWVKGPFTLETLNGGKVFKKGL